ncbi:MAG: phosphatidate cytidylyltransferase [Pirellulales bacterium]|nr:phosphatidate cytidylyltransferase [Pirellulales bacterium]
MLRWRFLLGTLIVAALAGLCWLDIHAPVPGLYLMPVVVLIAVLATRELLDMAAAVGIHPLKLPIYFGNVTLLMASWCLPHYMKTGLSSSQAAIGPVASETNPATSSVLAFAFFAIVLTVFWDEMRRFRRPGGNVANIAAGVFALFYIGLMLCFAIQMRVLYGVGAIAAWVITVKMCDSGAYFVGRMIGRHKLAPRISPGKTVEGVIGGLIFACLGSWLTFHFIIPFTIDIFNVKPGPWWGWLAFGLLVGAGGIFGDLVESLLKRDAGRKDSSNWMPGFGGVLDMLDSLLLSAPIAWFCWAAGMFGSFD